MTDSHHRRGIAANWLDGNFAADAFNRKWAGDITYIWTLVGWLYLAVILDLHSRRVMGWAASDRMKKGLAIRGIWRYACASHRMGAFSILIAAAHIVFTIIRRSCKLMACVYL